MEARTPPAHGFVQDPGAYNRISTLAAVEATSAVVAASAGNHAQGVALAASLSGLTSTVFMPVDAAHPKVEATRSYGADVIQVGETVDDCIREARRVGRRQRRRFRPPVRRPARRSGPGNRRTRDRRRDAESTGDRGSCRWWGSPRRNRRGDGQPPAWRGALSGSRLRAQHP